MNDIWGLWASLVNQYLDFNETTTEMMSKRKDEKDVVAESEYKEVENDKA